MEDTATTANQHRIFLKTKRFTRDGKTESALFVAKMTSGIRTSISAIKTLL